MSDHRKTIREFFKEFDETYPTFIKEMTSRNASYLLRLNDEIYLCSDNSPMIINFVNRLSQSK